MVNWNLTPIIQTPIIRNYSQIFGDSLYFIPF
jgi:hypothetical protein